MGRIDIMTSTLGKAMGGASGGFTLANKAIVAWLRQKSRPYLFSNTLSPAIVATSLKVLDMLLRDSYLIDRVNANTLYFRKEIEELGLQIIPGTHPIVPIMVYDAKKALDVADFMLKKGIYVVAFKFPVVPQGLARIRCQISAAHNKEELDAALAAFAEAKKEFDL